MSGPAPHHSGGRKRTAARLAAVQALYQIELAHAATESVIAEFIHHRLGRDSDGEDFGESDPALFGDLVRGTVARQDELDRLIGEALAPEWPLQRLETVLRATLRAGVYELLAREDVPAAVVISEYLDVAHAFFAGKEPGLVNGVLDRLTRSLRPREMAERSHDRDAAAR